MSRLRDTLGVMMGQKSGRFKFIVKKYWLSLFCAVGFIFVGTIVLVQGIYLDRLTSEMVQMKLDFDTLNKAMVSGKTQRSSVDVMSNSMSRTMPSSKFLMAPIQNGELMSKYGWNQDTTTGEWSYQRSIRVRPIKSTSISASGNGRVIDVVGADSGSPQLTVDYGARRKAIYKNMTKVYMRTDEEVKSGQIIGEAQILDFTLSINGTSVDPLNAITWSGLD